LRAGGALDGSARQEQLFLREVLHDHEGDTRQKGNKVIELALGIAASMFVGWVVVILLAFTVKGDK
jgi:hypothetical protein